MRGVKKMDNIEQAVKAMETETEIVENTAVEAKTIDKNTTIVLKERLKFLIIGLSYFAVIFLSKLALIFKPLYKKVYYGQANGHFEYGLGLAFVVVFILLIELVLKRKLKPDYHKEKTQLSWGMTAVLFAFTFIMIFIISALSGMDLKPVHDIGNNTTASRAGIFGTTLLYHVSCLYVAINMIENFQYALDDIIPFKNKKVSNYLPYGGIATMLTYGIYSLIAGLGGDLSVLYFFIVLAYGEVYLLTKRSLLKTFAVAGLIFVL